MVKYGDSGRAYVLPTPAYAAIGLEQPIDAVLILFLSPSPFSTFRLFLSIKRNKLSNDSPCFGPLSVGWSKELSRTREDRPDHRRWSWILRQGEGRLKGFSCVGIFVIRWSSTKNLRSLLDFSGVGAGEEQEKKKSLLLKKGRLSSEKVDTWPQGKTFAGLLCNQALAKRKLNKNKK